LAWVISSLDHSAFVPLDPSTLETLLALLRTIEGDERVLLQDCEKCTDEDDAGLAPAEAFLRGLHRQVKSLDATRSHVETALNISRFQEASQLEPDILKCLKAVQSVTSSRVLPVLLEGVLLVGNYVNASSVTLGGALGITLDSLAKLAHTKGKGANQSSSVLHILTGHLQLTHPSFLETLARDLEGCAVTQDIDPKLLSDRLRELEDQVRAVETLSRNSSAEQLPFAVSLERLQTFLTSALPKLQHLRGLLQELDQAAADFRRWFAEPAGSRFVDMMRSLAALHGALPAKLPQAAPGSVVGRRSSGRGSLKGTARTFQKQDSMESSEGSLIAGISEGGAITRQVSISSEADFEGPLNTLRFALLQMQGSPKAVDENENELSDEEDRFHAPLSSLRSVLGLLRPTALSANADANGCDSIDGSPAHWRRHGSISSRSDLDDISTTDAEATPAAFEAPLMDLQSVLSKLQSPSAVSSRSAPQPDNDDEEFEAPLFDLQQVLSTLHSKQNETSSSQGQQPQQSDAKQDSDIAMAWMAKPPTAPRTGNPRRVPMHPAFAQFETPLAELKQVLSKFHQPD